MKYFDIQKITDDIHLIKELFFSEHANIFLICSNGEELLIDCGTGVRNLRIFLEEHGHQPKVFLTHSHFDHVGGSKDFLTKDVMATEKTARNLKTPEFLALEYRRPELFGEGTYALPDVRVAATTIKSDTLRVGSYSFDIIPAPGHTDDSVILHDPQKGILITSDALYDGELYSSLSNSNKNDFIQTLEMIRGLKFDLVLPGHNSVINREHALEVIERWLKELSQSK